MNNKLVNEMLVICRDHLLDQAKIKYNQECELAYATLAEKNLNFLRGIEDDPLTDFNCKQALAIAVKKYTEASRLIFDHFNAIQDYLESESC